MRRTLILLVLVLFFMPLHALANPAEGDYLTAREFLTSTRGYALGNAMVASASGTSAIWHNPAAIASAITYAVDANYTYNHEKSGHGFETNIVDMKSNNYVGMGIGFLYQHMTPENSIKDDLIHLRFGFAVPLANNVISLGVSGLYSHILRNKNKRLGQFSMDVGLVIRPNSWLSIGFSAQNLIVGDYKYDMPRMIAVGVSAGSLELGLNAMFEASFNVSADNVSQTGSYGLGVEYVLQKFVPVRIGYRYESDAHHVLTAGLGYRHAEGVFGLDLAYQHHFNDFSNEVISASLNLYF